MSITRKRLHVSGLTPAITANDINARLQGFGKVLALDGFGVLNAVGEPRKFAYVTLEATEANLARCLNALSGATWKGTKLRIGEAKPDYTQRLENERKRATEGGEERPSKRSRLPRGVQGVHAKDMSVVNLTNLASHPGWHKTALSHLIRPMKMRPSHPLPEIYSGQKLDSMNKKRKKKKLNLSNVATRACVRIIDPRLYGAVHLREEMLEAVVESHPSPMEKNPPSPSSSSSGISSFPEANAHQLQKSLSVVEDGENVAIPDFEKEKARDLDLLTAMFGDDESQWVGKESLEDTLSDGSERMSDIVATAVKSPTTTLELQQPIPSPSKQKPKSLKDMFRPHEEEADFSLLAGLGDFDLDLDPDFDLLDAPALTATSAPAVSTMPLPVPSQPGITLDPTLPLFFPHPDNPRAKDLFAFARIEGWEFGRSGDSDTIRKRWEETRGSLTREWKKRSREAVKSRKRRYGVTEAEDV